MRFVCVTLWETFAHNVVSSSPVNTPIMVSARQ